MKFLPEDDNIVALSSPMGNGAIAVIRISGKDVRTIANPLLNRPVTPADARRAVFTGFYARGGNRLIDQVVVTYFKAPASYTGEDVLEISCHCNPLIINTIIEEIIHQGARMARPGEFTFRAFMNGKLDLSQAEAVAEIINSRSRQSLVHSLRHLEGNLSGRIEDIKSEIMGYLSLLEISLDFSEEDIEIMPYDKLQAGIGATGATIRRLIDSYDYGKLLQEGIRLLILGKPNVGKSSLLNSLLDKERAIVSDIPGTTRDYIEARVEIDGLGVQAVDTAGIRRTDDRIEAIGVERALEQLKTADIALAMFEAQRAPDGDDAVLLDIIRDHLETVKFVAVMNKSDLGNVAETRAALSALNLPVVTISVRDGQGISDLKKTIKEQLLGEAGMETEDVVVTSARHIAALERTAGALDNALSAIRLGAGEEIVAVDIRLALDHLGEITGETTSEDILNHIFANFCIGK